MKSNYLIKVFVSLIILLIFCSTHNVYAGRGCCSHHEGVDNARCTIDGRQVCKDDTISNGDSCKCDPNIYSEENLVDPEGHDETNPYSYWDSSNNYENSNNSSNQYNDLEIGNKDNKNTEEIVDKNIKEDYLALSCTALIGTLIVYLNGIPPKKERGF